MLIAKFMIIKTIFTKNIITYADHGLIPLLFSTLWIASSNILGFMHLSKLTFVSYAIFLALIKSLAYSLMIHPTWTMPHSFGY